MFPDGGWDRLQREEKNEVLNDMINFEQVGHTLNSEGGEMVLMASGSRDGIAVWLVGG